MKPDKKTLDKWAKMTDENQHFEVRREIARFFTVKPSNNRYFSDMFVEAFDELIRSRHFGCYPLRAEILLTNSMFEEIRKKHGNEAADAALACL